MSKDNEDTSQNLANNSERHQSDITVQAKLDILLNSLDNIRHRIDALEIRTEEVPNSAERLPHQANSDSVGPRLSQRGRQAFSGARSSMQNVDFSDVRFVQANSEYENIRDKFKSVRLPEELKLHDSRSGVRREDQQQYNRLVKSARMVETTFRILAGIETVETEALDDKLGDIFLVQFALLKYLQDEYAVLMVNGATNSETARIFRSFRRNASAFAPDVIEDLRSAATVVAAGQFNAPAQRSQFTGFRSARPGRGRGFVSRGGFYNSFNNRRFHNNNSYGGYNNSSYNNRGGYDPYSQLGRAVPFSREREDN